MGLEEVKNQVIDKALRFIKRETGKKPLVMPIIVNLD
jgi:hypothetical protein